MAEAFLKWKTAKGGHWDTPFCIGQSHCVGGSWKFSNKLTTELTPFLKLLVASPGTEIFLFVCFLRQPSAGMGNENWETIYQEFSWVHSSLTKFLHLAATVHYLLCPDFLIGPCCAIAGKGWHAALCHWSAQCTDTDIWPGSSSFSKSCGTRQASSWPWLLTSFSHQAPAVWYDIYFLG